MPNLIKKEWGKKREKKKKDPLDVEGCLCRGVAARVRETGHLGEVERGALHTRTIPCPGTVSRKGSMAMSHLPRLFNLGKIPGIVGEIANDPWFLPRFKNPRYNFSPTRFPLRFPLPT